jgi:FAD binding domain
MQGRVLLPSDAVYADGALWNGAVSHQPALIALCKTTEDVQRAIRAARAHRLPLSVRCGGHDWAGRALCHEGLVIVFSEMRHVELDPRARAATVAGGAQAGDLIAAATPARSGGGDWGGRHCRDGWNDSRGRLRTVDSAIWTRAGQPAGRACCPCRRPDRHRRRCKQFRFVVGPPWRWREFWRGSLHAHPLTPNQRIVDRVDTLSMVRSRYRCCSGTPT